MTEPITWTLRLASGGQIDLPQPVGWRLEYGLGSPCDSFWVKFLWSDGREDLLAEGYRMAVTRGGETLFFGVVDECRCQWSREGCTAELTGRGMQALLLDNQAEAADFDRATLEDVLRRYVTPYGIQVAGADPLPAVDGFSVASGSSCWKVLYQFARYHGGVTPRFDRRGRLDLRDWADGDPLVVDAAAPVTGLTLSRRRYGVLSRVTVKDVSGWERGTAVNRTFEAQGGQATRVILVPRNTGYQAKRYNAKFQLERSWAKSRQVELTLALPFAAWPGDLVLLARPGWSQNGKYRVQESRVRLGERGVETTLTLGYTYAVL